MQNCMIPHYHQNTLLAISKYQLVYRSVGAAILYRLELIGFKISRVRVMVSVKSWVLNE